MLMRGYDHDHHPSLGQATACRRGDEWERWRVVWGGIMKCIIAGSRHIQDIRVVERAIARSGWRSRITEIVSGGARGVDTNGEIWATRVGVPWRRFEPDYAKHGRKYAPLMRNEEMAQYADALILVWDGESRGSANMLMHARNYGLNVFEYRWSASQ